MQKPLLPLIAFAIVTASLTAVAVDVIPLERTVAERVKGMDAVLRVRAVGEPVVRGDDHGPSLRAANPGVVKVDPNFGKEPMLLPLIEQEVDVLEVIKGRSVAVAGTTILVGTSGGHNGMHLASDWRERTMVVGGTYVLFLNEQRNSQQLRYAYFDIFRIDPPLVTTPYRGTAYARSLLGTTPSEALAHIRDAVKNGQR